MPSEKALKSNADLDFNLLLYINLVITIVGIIYLAWKKFDAGYIYFIMISGFFTLISMTFLFVKNEKSIRGLTNYIKIPFAVNLGLACFFYLMGKLMPYVIELVIVFFKGVFGVGQGFHVHSFAIPFFGSEINQAYTSFSTAQIGISQSMENFVIEFVSGNCETFVYNFGAMIIGGVVGIGLFNLMSSDGKKVGFLSKKFFILIVAFVFSIATFMISHTLNGSYSGFMFVVAGLFLLVGNFSIYKLGVFLSFWFGYHQSNNQIWLITQEGFRQVMSGYISVYGVIYFFMFGVIIFYVIRNWSSIKVSFRKWVLS